MQMQDLSYDLNNHKINAKDYKEKFTGYNYTITFAGNPAYDDREKLLSKINSY